MRTTITMLAASLVLFGGVAHAASGMGNARAQRMMQMVQERFQAADTNHDGALSQDEASKGMPRLAEHFSDIDANHDGYVTLSEITAYAAGQRAARSRTAQP